MKRKAILQGCFVLVPVMWAVTAGCGADPKRQHVPFEQGFPATNQEGFSKHPGIAGDGPAEVGPGEPAETALAVGPGGDAAAGSMTGPVPNTHIPILASEWYVSPSGSDSAGGTSTAPFRTITRAIAAAGPGDRITVRAGTYAERIDIGAAARDGRPDARIILRGENRPKIVPGHSSWLMLAIQRPYWTVDGFEIDARGQAKCAVAFIGNTEGSALSRSDVHHGSSGAGVTTFGNARGVLIENNRIHDFWRASGQDSHGVLVQPSSRNITIRGNEIYGNSGDSIQCIGNEGTGKPMADGVLIESNDLHSSVEQAVDIKTCQNVTVRRNRMHHFRPHGNSTMVVHMSARNVLVEENDMYDAGAGIGVGGSRDGPMPYNIVVRRNRIRDMITEGGMTGAGIIVQNSERMTILNNTLTRLQGPGLILGNGVGGPTSNLTAKNNLVDAAVLVKLGSHAPGLVMNSNLYRPGGVFRSPVGTLTLAQWKARGLDPNSQQAPLGLDPTSLTPGVNAIDKGENVGLSFCGSAPDIGAVETGCTR